MLSQVMRHLRWERMWGQAWRRKQLLFIQHQENGQKLRSHVRPLRDHVQVHEYGPHRVSWYIVVVDYLMPRY